MASSRSTALALFGATIIGTDALGFGDAPISTVHRAHYGDSQRGTFGYSVAGLDDVNGDGVPEYVIGAPASDTIQGWAGVYSGADGSLVHFWGSESSVDLQGLAVANAGDVDDDGVEDVIVGAPGTWVNGVAAVGKVRVYSGTTGLELHEWTGVQEAGSIGMSVASAGDVNGDGFADVIIGAPNHDVSSSLNRGRAFVYSGESGLLLYSMTGTSAYMRVGNAVAGMGDVNDDGFDDVLISAPGADRVHIVDARHSAILLTVEHPGTGAGADFGLAAANAGDVNADGVNDIITSAVSSSLGEVFLFDGATGSLLHTFTRSGGSGFGHAVAGAGDVDGDGHADVLIGAPNFRLGDLRSGRVEVRSGRTGDLLDVFTGGTSFTDFGSAVASIGDLNDDGTDDVLVGAQRHDASGSDGAAFVFLGGTHDESLHAEAFASIGMASPSMLISTDVDNDSAPDLLSFSLTRDRLSINLNRGDGRYYGGHDYAAGNGPTCAAAADLNRDGRQDLAVTLANSKKLALFKLRTVGQAVFEGTLPTGKKPSAVVAVDFNRDNRPDLAVAHKNSSVVCVWMRKPLVGTRELTKQFKARKSYSVGSGVTALHAGDIDHNNRPDLFAVHGSTGVVSVLRRTSGSSFAATVNTATGGPVSRSCTADMNDDGRADLVLARPGSTVVEIWTSASSGTLSYFASTDLGVRPTCVIAADLDRDGRIDLAACESASHTVAVVRNDGGGAFGAAETYSAGIGPAWLVAMDADSDGDIDLASVNSVTQSIAVLQNKWFD